MSSISDIDKKTINLISEITKAIAKTYERLLLADMSKEERDQEIYNNIILNLKDLIDKETILYKALNINFDNQEKLWNYFVESNGLENFEIEDQFVDVFNSDTKSLWYYRIFNRFQDCVSEADEYSLVDEETYADDYDYDEEELFGEITNYLDEDKIEELIERAGDDKVRDAIDDDFQRAFIYFLGEEIKETDNEFIKDNFAQVRYNILFVTPKIEKEFLDNNLQNKEDLYFTFPISSGLFEMDNEHFEQIQKEEALSFCNEAMNIMLELQTLEQEDSQFAEVNARLFAVYFRAGLSLLYNNTIYTVPINDFIEDETITDNQRAAVNKIINTCLKDVKKDMGKCKYLSLYTGE